MFVRQGIWTLIYSESVFTYTDHAGVISSSVALYEMVDDESDSKVAVFLIGKKHYVYRVELTLIYFSDPGIRRPVKVCDPHHRVIHVSNTKHAVLVVCDNKVYWMKIGEWSPVDITPQELMQLTFNETSVKVFLSEYVNISFGLISINVGGNFKYCFVGPLTNTSQHPLSHCGTVLNASLTHGLLVTRNNIQFLALLNGSTLTVISNDSNVIINKDFCYPQDNCYLLQTENVIYFGNQKKCRVLDRETFRTIMIYNVSVYDVLPYRYIVSPSSTSTNVPTSISTITMMNVNTSAIKPTPTTSIDVTHTPTVTSTSVTTTASSSIITTRTITNDRSIPTKTTTPLNPSSTTNNSTIKDDTVIKDFGILGIIAAVLVLIVLLLTGVILILCRLHLRWSRLKLNLREVKGKSLKEKSPQDQEAQQPEGNDAKTSNEMVLPSSKNGMYALHNDNTTLNTYTMPIKGQKILVNLNQ